MTKIVFAAGVGPDAQLLIHQVQEVVRIARTKNLTVGDVKRFLLEELERRNVQCPTLTEGLKTALVPKRGRRSSLFAAFRDHFGVRDPLLQQIRDLPEGVPPIKILFYANAACLLGAFIVSPEFAIKNPVFVPVAVWTYVLTILPYITSL